MSPPSRSACSRSARLATVRPIMPRPSTRDTPSGSSQPYGSGKLRQRQAQQEPHEEADEEAQDGRDELARGHRADAAHERARRQVHREVRQDRVARPRTRRRSSGQEEPTLERGSSSALLVATETRKGDGEETPETAAEPTG